MIRIVYIPVEDTKRTTKFIKELDIDTLLDVGTLVRLSVVSDVSGEILHDCYCEQS